MKRQVTGNRTVRPSLDFEICRQVTFRSLVGTPAVEGTGLSMVVSSKKLEFISGTGVNLGRELEISLSWPARLHGRIPLKLVVYGIVTYSQNGCLVAEIDRYEFKTTSDKFTR